MQKRLYNLDGLRFLAAWIVVLCHLEIMKPMFSYPALSGRFFSNSAQLAVTFFFVLSGFLICYLLLLEKRQNPSGRIHISRFYKKRILRIWPLYYLLVLLAFFVFDKSSFFSGIEQGSHPRFLPQRFLGYLFFLPNTTEYYVGKEFYLGQTWSLGVEEFFYLFFPIALSFIRWKFVPRLLMGVVIVYFIFSVGAFGLQAMNYRFEGLDALVFYLDRYRLYSFGLGGLAAWLLVRWRTDKKFPLRFVQTRTAGILMLFLLVPLVGFGVTFSIATQQVYSIYFALMLLVICVSETRFGLINHPSLVYLGKISYGIYMLHPIALVTMLHIVRNWNMDGAWLSAFLALGGSVLSVVLAALSYELYEKFFLRLRNG